MTHIRPLGILLLCAVGLIVLALWPNTSHCPLPNSNTIQEWIDCR